MSSPFTLSNVNQTALVPQSILGYDNTSQYISINASSGIVLYDTSLNITTTIAWNGIESDKTNGIDILSPLNMNNKDINNVDTISSQNSSNLSLQSTDNVYINTTGFQVNASDFVDIKANNDFMTLTAGDDITLQSTEKGIVITAGIGDGIAGDNDIKLTTIDGTPSGGSVGNIILDSAGEINLDSSGNITLDSSGNINLTASTGNGKIYANSDIRMVDAAEPTWITTLEAGSLSFDISGNSVKKYVVIDADGGANIQVSINDNGIESYSSLMPNKLTLGYQANSFTINHDTSNNLILDSSGNMILQADNEITLNSRDGDIQLTPIKYDGFNYVGVVYVNKTTPLDGNGEIKLNTVTAQGLDALTLKAGDNIQLTCGENFFVQTNSTTGIVSFATGDLANTGVVKWNGYPMGITFFNKWEGGAFTYLSAGNWEMVRANKITFPSQFFYGTWAVSFSINCWEEGSHPSDQSLAMYFDILDGVGNIINGFNYRKDTPYAQHFNRSDYPRNPLSITYTDYFDFTSATDNNIQLQINWYGSSIQNQNFNVSTTFTLMNTIT
jgi:uncharacterized protein (DUF2345 family)